MEKKRIIVYIILSSLALLLFGIIFSSYLKRFYIDIVNFISSPLFYWLLLFVWILILFKFKLKSRVTLKAALILLILGAIFAVVKMLFLSEPFLRLSFVFWLIGIPQALIEIKKKDEN